MTNTQSYKFESVPTSKGIFGMRCGLVSAQIEVALDTHPNYNRTSIWDADTPFGRAEKLINYLCNSSHALRLEAQKDNDNAYNVIEICENEIVGTLTAIE